jgi:hypothetical protein
MKFKTLIFLSILFLSYSTTGRTQDQEYSPVTGTNLEKAFPIATKMLMESLGLGLYQFDYGGRILKSSYYE